MMKIRQDFVTNSSSSNYIIAYRNLPEFDDDTLAKYPFLKNYGKLIERVLFSRGSCETTSGTAIKSKEAWDNYFIERYGWRSQHTVEEVLADDDDLTKLYNKATELLSKGFYILDKDVDNYDQYCANMLNALAEDDDNFIIIEGDD